MNTGKPWLVWFCMLAAWCSIPANAGEALRTEPVQFESHGVTLSGTLVLPAGKIQAAVVFVHGSGPQTRNLELASLFARDGIAALVYDKRGVGKSGGQYESQQSVSGMNISLLADDAASALKSLSSHPALREVRVGITGISQAGWIAPLAAERSGVARFIVLWSGPVCKVSEEDIYSKYTTDSDGAAPPYAQALAARKQKYIWPDFLGVDTDPADTLRKLKIPGLWIFSDNDGSIPVDLSIARVDALRKSGGRYDHVVFSGLGHNNIDRTFATAADWIRRAVR